MFLYSYPLNPYILETVVHCVIFVAKYRSGGSLENGVYS